MLSAPEQNNMNDSQNLNKDAVLESDFVELSDSQLAFIGGGIGDVVGA